MKRRQTILALLLCPVCAFGQPAGKRIPRLGVLIFGTPESDPNFGAFRLGMRELGYVDGANITFIYRSAEGKPERLRSLAAELAELKPDAIVALGGDVAPFARAATSTIPIVMVVSTDPVESGLVASFARPGGNVTGLTLVSSDLAAKRLQVLKEMAPRVSRVAILWNPDHIDPEYRETQRVAQGLGVTIQSLEVRGPGDFEAAFRAAVAGRAEAIIPISSRLLATQRKRVLSFAAEHQLLLVSGWGPWAAEGAVFSYGPDLDPIFRRAASYVDKILHGAKPADLPVEQPTRFELIVNMKTARALGLSVPQSVLVRADKVIE